MSKQRVIRTSQPQGPVQIDWSNPLTKGLIFASNTSAGIDAVSGKSLIAGSTGSAITVGTSGIGTKNNGGYSGQFLTVPAIDVTSSSIFALYSSTSTGGDRAVFGFGGSGASPFSWIQTDTTATTKLRLFARNNASAQTASPAGTITAFNDSKVHAAAIVSNGSTMSAYVDGVFDSQTAWVCGTSTITGFALGAGYRNGTLSGANGSNALVYAGYAWNRALSDAEVESLSANPWQIFQPISKQIYAGPRTELNALPGAVRSIGKVVRTTQPQTPVGMDYSNSITKGIVYSNVGSKLPNKISGASIRPLTGTNAIGSTLDTRNGGGFRVPIGDLTNGFTVCITLYIPGATVPSGVVASITDGTIGAGFSGTGGFVLQFYSPTSLFINDNTQFFTIAQVPTSTVKVGVPITVLFTVTSNNIGSTYYNGRSYLLGGSLGGSSVVPAIGNSSYLEYGDPDTSGSFGYAYNQVTVWNRVLSKAEALLITKNPWQIFQPQAVATFADSGLAYTPPYINPDVITAPYAVSNSSAKFRRVVRTQQPQGPVGIDWSNPITRGLAAVFDCTNGVDILSAARPTTNTTTKTVNASGLSAKFSNSSEVYAHRPAYAITGALTIFCPIVVNTLTNYSGILTKSSNYTNSLPFELRLGSSITSSEIDFQRSNGVAASAFKGSSSLISASPGVVQRLAVRCVSGDVNIAPDVFVNNTKTTLARNGYSVVTGNAVDTGQSLRIGNRFDGTTYLDGQIPILLLFNRALSDAEIASLSANPWQIFQPQAKTLFANPMLLPQAAPGKQRSVAKTVRTKQPQGPVGIDWSNPITRGLALSITGTAMVDLVSQSLATTSPSRKILSKGASPTAAATFNITPVTTSNGTGTGQFTLLVFGTFTSRPTKVDAYSQVSGAESSWMQANASGSTGAAVAGMFSFGVYNAGGGYADAAGVLDGNPHVFIGRRDTAHALFVDGVNKTTASNASVAVNARPSAGTTAIGGTYTSAEGIFLSCAWNRALSDAEIASISANPWQIFKPATAPQFSSTDPIITKPGQVRSLSGHTMRATMPTYQVGLDNSSPIAKGIVFSTVGDTYRGINIGTSPLPTTGINSIGPAQYLGNRGALVSTGYMAPLNNPISTCSFLLVFTLPVTGNNRTVISLCNLSRTTVLNVDTLSNGVLSINDWNSGDFISTGAVTGAGKPVILLVTIVAGGYWTAYTYGKNTVSLVKPSFGSATHIEIGDSANYGQLGQPALINSIVVWDRALSPSEANLLVKNPWQVFAPVATPQFASTGLVVSTPLPTIGRPDSDVTQGAWSSTGPNLYSQVSEELVDDTSYISVNAASTTEMTLSATAFPGTATQSISYRAQSASGSTITVTLKQGATTIATWSHTVTPVMTTYSQVLTAPQIASITNAPLSVSITSS